MKTIIIQKKKKKIVVLFTFLRRGNFAISRLLLIITPSRTRWLSSGYANRIISWPTQYGKVLIFFNFLSGKLMKSRRPCAFRALHFIPAECSYSTTKCFPVETAVTVSNAYVCRDRDEHFHHHDYIFFIKIFYAADARAIIRHSALTRQFHPRFPRSASSIIVCFYVFDYNRLSSEYYPD